MLTLEGIYYLFTQLITHALVHALLRLCLSFISAASFYRSSSKATNQRWGTISWQQQKGDMFSDAPGGVDINPNKNINIFWIAWQISYHSQSPINNFTPSRILHPISLIHSGQNAILVVCTLATNEKHQRNVTAMGKRGRIGCNKILILTFDGTSKPHHKTDNPAGFAGVHHEHSVLVVT